MADNSPLIPAIRYACREMAARGLPRIKTRSLPSTDGRCAPSFLLWPLGIPPSTIGLYGSQMAQAV
jgi:hypothetical protein